MLQSQTLQRYVREHNYQHVTSIEDLGSGLNYKKEGLVLLLKMIFNKEFEIFVVNHRDRLLRFGFDFDLMEKMCINHGIRIIVIDEQKKSFEEQLTQDVIELMTVFCAKLYGKRSHKNKLTT
jgi:predicted site-specific integrase-resolvase